MSDGVVGQRTSAEDGVNSICRAPVAEGRALTEFVQSDVTSAVGSSREGGASIRDDNPACDQRRHLKKLASLSPFPPPPSLNCHHDYHQYRTTPPSLRRRRRRRILFTVLAIELRSLISDLRKWRRPNFLILMKLLLKANTKGVRIRIQ
ncbi:bromodomain and WD repeat-containing protein 3 [Striga asiatica]|uniref:Bromodomain and WD repeat-containing protein 3 n=1 Tax=Striga asiatica TaxID=4170 RepID=A0A5A7Q400_STRAF|nr:bromodomain and WD repeat-containing protein 3 [Striga asiatica]